MFLKIIEWVVWAILLIWFIKIYRRGRRASLFANDKIDEWEPLPGIFYCLLIVVPYLNGFYYFGLGITNHSPLFIALGTILILTFIVIALLGIKHESKGLHINY